MNHKEIRLEQRYYAQVFHRHPIVLTKGKGSIVWDTTGREYIDLTAGWGVCCLGHCHPRIISALTAQAEKLMVVSNLFYTPQQSMFAEQLVAACPEGIDRVFFVNSGSEAAEGAIKLARRATGKVAMLATENGFHGRTLGALSATGQPKHQAPYQPLLPGFKFVPYNDLDAMAEAMTCETAAVILEPIQGEGGVHVADAAYLQGIRKLCDRFDALLILDEIQTGVGRTGAFLACLHAGVVPDILCLGKGIGGGFPLAAFLASERVMNACKPGDHGGTYSGNPLACAVGHAVVETVLEEGLSGRAAQLGTAVMERLSLLQQHMPSKIKDVRGKGLLIGLQMASTDLAKGVISKGIERGVLYNQTAGDVIRLFPALNIPEDLLWQGVETLCDTITTLEKEAA